MTPQTEGRRSVLIAARRQRRQIGNDAEGFLRFEGREQRPGPFGPSRRR